MCVSGINLYVKVEVFGCTTCLIKLLYLNGPARISVQHFQDFVILFWSHVYSSKLEGAYMLKGGMGRGARVKSVKDSEVVEHDWVGACFLAPYSQVVSEVRLVGDGRAVPGGRC